jgi:hypothetical protein
MTPARTEPDLSFLLDHTSHVLRSKMSAALAETCSPRFWLHAAPYS